MSIVSCVKILKLTLGRKWREEGEKDNILLLLSLIK